MSDLRVLPDEWQVAGVDRDHIVLRLWAPDQVQRDGGPVCGLVMSRDAAREVAKYLRLAAAIARDEPGILVSPGQRLADGEA